MLYLYSTENKRPQSKRKKQGDAIYNLYNLALRFIENSIGEYPNSKSRMTNPFIASNSAQYLSSSRLYI